MNWRIDWSQQVVIKSTGADAHAAMPADTNRPASNYWLMMVEGGDAYVNVGAAATNANAAVPVGVQARPMAIGAGTVVHVLSTGASSVVSFVRCYPA